MPRDEKAYVGCLRRRWKFLGHASSASGRRGGVSAQCRHRLVLVDIKSGQVF